MAQEDVQKALIAMDDDDDVRARLANGDFSAVDGMTLTSEEETLVSDAAADMPDVAGFASDYLLTLDGIKGESFSLKLDGLYHKLGTQNHKFQAALKYGYKI